MAGHTNAAQSFWDRAAKKQEAELEKVGYKFTKEEEEERQVRSSSWPAASSSHCGAQSASDVEDEDSTTITTTKNKNKNKSNNKNNNKTTTTTTDTRYYHQLFGSKCKRQRGGVGTQDRSKRDKHYHHLYHNHQD